MGVLRATHLLFQLGTSRTIVILNMSLLESRRGKNLMGTLLSDIVLQVLLSFAVENGRANIRQRQAESIAAAKVRGVRFGTPPRPLPENYHSVTSGGRAITGTAAKECGLRIDAECLARNMIGSAGG